MPPKTASSLPRLTHRRLTTLLVVLLGIASGTDCGAQQAVPMPIELDLSSTERNLTAGKLPESGVIDILVGSDSRIIDAHSALTASERLAVYQKFSTGVQSITLGQAGNAVGGTFTMGAHFQNYVSGIVIPQGVTAVRDFGVASTLNLSGNLINHGNLVATSSNPTITNAQINANNIVNSSGAVLSSLPPSASALVQHLDLSLNAVNNIVNNGLITSSGNLNLTAGGSIINESIASATNAAVMQAVQDVSLQTSSLINSGIIQSIAGSINVSSLNSANLAISAMQGQFIADQLNLNAGAGRLNADLGNVIGTLNAQANYAHVGVSQGTLSLGNLDVTGDPTYFNSAVNGDIVLSGTIIVDEALSIIASRDILSTATATLIQARDPLGQGYNIHLIAGANVSGIGTTTAAIGTTPPVAGNSTSAVTINGASGSGGNLDFTGSPNLQINANSTCVGCNGANVVMAAFANGASGGRILLPTQTSIVDLGSHINVSGNGTGNNGNIQLIAGAQSGVAVQTGGMLARGGAGNSATAGNIYISTAQPTTSDGNPLVFGVDGSITSGNRLLASSTINNGSVQVTNNLIAGQSINIQAGGDILTKTGVVATIPVPHATTLFVLGDAFHELGEGAVINNAGTRAYIANLNNNSVSVIDTFTNTVIATVQINAPAPVATPPLLNNPFGVLEGIAVTPDDQYVLVASIFGDAPLGLLGPGYVAFIRTSDNVVVNRLETGSFPFPAAITIDANGKYAYVSNEGLFPNPPIMPIGFASTVSIIDINKAVTLQPGAVVGNINLQFDPFQSILSPNGQYLYALNAVASANPGDPITPASIAVIDTTRALASDPSAVVNTIPISFALDTLTLGITIHPSGSKLYVSNAATNSVMTYDLTNPANPVLTATLNIGQQPAGLSMDPAGTFLYVENSFLASMPPAGAPPLPVPPSGNVTIIRTADNVIVDTVQLGVVPLVFSNKYVGYSGDNLLGYLRNEGDYNNDNRYGDTVSAFRLPSISAPVVNLSSLGGNITGGVNTASLAVNTGGTGSVALTSNTSTTLQNSSAGNIFQLGTTGTLTINGAISAPNVNLFAGQGIFRTANPVRTSSASTELTTTALPNLLPTFNLPPLQSSTILPTDTLPLVADIVDKPIQLSAEVSEGVQVQIFRASKFDAVVLAQLVAAGIDIERGASDSAVVLKNGYVFFAPTEDISVRVNNGTVFIKRDSVVLILASESNVAILDLHDDLTGDVTVALRDHVAQLAPGQELVIAKTTAGEFAQVNPATVIGFRNVVKAADGDDDISYFTAEFPIIRALQFGTIGQQLMGKTPGDSGLQAVLNKTLKSAASVQISTATHGRYGADQER